MNIDTAIKVQHVSKTFHEQMGARSFKQGFISLGRKVVGKKEKTLKKGEFTALKDINFEVKKGEFFGIVGRNGSGKSTLLKIMAGVYTPDKGFVSKSGMLTPFIELGVGFNPELSGRDNVFLNGALLGFTRKQMEEMYDDIVEFAELKDFMEVKLKNYSSGMQVRLAFSIAIRAESGILLFDEVLAVGDVNFQNKCITVFEEIKKKGTTVVFVSHDMEAVRRFCDRVILLERGQITKTGNAQELIDEYLAINVSNSISNGSPFGVESNIMKDETKVKIIRTIVMNNKLDKTTTINTPKYFVDIEVRFLDDCDDIIPGVVLRNQSGIRVTASNTAWIKVPSPDAKKGQKSIFRFEFMNVLERGKYFVSSNAVSAKTGKFYDWDNDAVSFRVVGKPLTGGVVNPWYGVEVL